MGMNSENAMRIIFDIETAPLPEAADYLVEPIEAPANYKDPAKIETFIAAEKLKQLERCGLDVDLCTIVAIGWQREGEPSVQALTREDCDEDGLIAEFWRQATQGGDLRHLVGFNCLAFDLPVLMRRSQYLGISAPAYQIDKYRHAQVTDLAQVLSFNGAVRMRSLTFYAKRFGVEVADTITGANVAQKVAEGDWGAIRTHVSADVSKTAMLAAKLGYFHLEQAVPA